MNFKEEICNRNLCEKCLGIDSASIMWRVEESKWLGIDPEWPVVCGKKRMYLDMPIEQVTHVGPLVHFDKLSKVLMSVPDRVTYEMIVKESKACGCKNKYPRLQQQLMEKYSKYAGKRTLIVGNADIPLNADINNYDNIVVFNNIKQRQIMQYATAHWCRSDKHDLRHHGGEHLIPLHRALPVLVDCGKHGLELVEKYKSRGAIAMSCRSVVSTRDYPKTPSTGYAAIKYYIKLGHQVDIACFTWEGNKVHDWDKEASDCATMLRTNTIRILDNEPSTI